ncbi:MAG: rhodanese-related sulfurtransferase [Gammaproteobacteria bacterium]
MQYTLAAFYKFSEQSLSSERLLALRLEIQKVCADQAILGTVLLAPEGINGTVACLDSGALSCFTAFVAEIPELLGLEFKYSKAETGIQPFVKAKVLIKKEIVALGIPGLNPAKETGHFLDAKAWDLLLEDPEVLCIDTRNAYEIEYGSFKNAINPKTRSFKQFPAFIKAHFDPEKHKKIAMFCTGGIRCEKASAYMLSLGFENLYQLKGGILKYLEETPNNSSLNNDHDGPWQGDCFIFDQRWSVNRQHLLKSS